MDPSAILFGITLALYAASGAMYVTAMVNGRRGASAAAEWLAIAGLIIQTVGIVLMSIEQHTPFFANLFGSLVFFAWAIMAVYLVMARGHRISAIGAFAGVMAAVAIAVGLVIPREVGEALRAALKSPWSTIHIGSSLISYAGFVLAFGAVLTYSLQERMLKAKRINSMQKSLPPLDALDRLAYRMVAFAFPMLTLGIVTGALWAQSAWGSYWNWDPKETWALITWLIYAAYLHVRVMQGWRGKWANRLLLAGFTCIIVTFFGVNLLSHGLHRYNW